MNNILDEIEIKHSQTKFSKLSFAISLITLGLICYLLFGIPSTVKVSEGFHAPPLIIIIAAQVSCLIGTIMTVLSLIMKETSTWYKWVGGVLNTIVFLLILGSVIFARLV